jgi:hypothetical protein
MKDMKIPKIDFVQIFLPVVLIVLAIVYLWNTLQTPEIKVAVVAISIILILILGFYIQKELKVDNGLCLESEKQPKTTSS